MDPLWNSVVVAGMQGGQPFLSTIGMLGTNYTDTTVATGARVESSEVFNKLPGGAGGLLMAAAAGRGHALPAAQRGGPGLATCVLFSLAPGRGACAGAAACMHPLRGPSSHICRATPLPRILLPPSPRPRPPGFGNHLARPLMREKHSPEMGEADAVALLHECLRVCYYRDKNSINRFTIAKVRGVGLG